MNTSAANNEINDSGRGVGVLFDLDGVLVDTESVYTRFWSDMDRLFPTGIEDFAHSIKGTTLPDILGRHFPDAEHRSRIVGLLKELEDNMAYELFEGTEALLAELRERGIPAAIVTSSGDAKMARLFGGKPGFREYFKAVVTDSMVKRSKPHPDPYLTGARALGLEPEDCFAVEDSFAGVESGLRAGCTVIALATTNPRSAMEGLGAALVLDSIAELGAEAMLSLRRAL